MTLLRYQRRAYDGKAVKGAADGHRRGRAESRAYISVERAMGRQRREQWTAIDEDGVILLNFHTPCTFTLRRAKERSTAHGHRRKVR